jgi:hypothetical protein
VKPRHQSLVPYPMVQNVSVYQGATLPSWVTRDPLVQVTSPMPPPLGRPTLRHYPQGCPLLHGLVDPRDRAVSGCPSRPDPRLPWAARVFWVKVGLSWCTKGVVARAGGTPVGFCRYCLSSRSRSLQTTRELFLAGTWVQYRYRRTGLAFRQLPNGANLMAVTATPGGTRLVKSFVDQYPDLHFDIEPHHRCPA